MQSETRIAFSYLSARTARVSNKINQKHHGIYSHVHAITSDLLLAWDASAIFASGIVTSTLYSAVVADTVPAGLESGLIVGDLQYTAALGALLSPILFRAQLPLRVDGETLRSVIRRAASLIALVLALAVATGAARTVPSLWAAGWVVSVVALIVAGRLLAAVLLRWTAGCFGGERVAVIGTGPEAEWLRTTLRGAKPAGVDLVAPGRRAGSLGGVLADLLEQGRNGEVDRVILAQPGWSDEQVQHVAHRLKALRIEVASLLPLLGAEAARPTAELADIPLFVVARRPQRGYGGLTKAAMDRILAALLLLWTAPLLLLIAAAIALDSPGPVLFRQRRHGVNGGEFDIFKFRTMTWQGPVASNGATQTQRGDRRITRVGALLRQTSLDEVPQLLNVLNGTMSLVGPRPHPTVMRTEQRLGDEIIAEYPHRHRVKPGITGWAQINGLRGATDTAEQLRRRVEHDNFYIENWSPWFDLRIIAMTPVALVIRRDNAF